MTALQAAERRPKVLLIAEAANPEWVSVPLVGWNVAQALREVAEVLIVTHVRNRDAMVRAGLIQGKDFICIDSEALARPLWKLAERIRGGPGVGWTTLAAVAWPSYLYFEHLLWRELGPRIQAREWDLVHRVTPLSPTLPSLIARKLRRAKVPFVIGPLNGGTPWPAQFAQARRAEREWLSYVRGAYRYLPGYRSTREDASALLVASRATWAELPERWRDRAVYIPENGIDPARFHSREARARSGPLRVIFVGRLVPYKGADMLIDAAAGALLERRMYLEIVGDGPQMAELVSQVRRLGLGESVTFHGWQEQTRVAELLETADLSAFPSIREFGGGAVLEAMACAVPPLVVDYGGPGELVTQATGYKVPLGSRAEIVDSMRRTLDGILVRPEELLAKGRAARQRVERHYTWSKKAEQLRAVYEWVLGRAGKPDFGMPLREASGNGETRASAHVLRPLVKVAATVVNYRTPVLATKAVTGLLAQLRLLGPHHLYLVDNASGDDSLDLFRQAGERDGWGNSVTVVASTHNGGYGYGINLAMRQAQVQAEPPDYLYVLNSDAVADEGTLRRLIDFMDGDPRVGIAGSRIHGPDGATQVTAFRFPSVLGELEQAARLGLATRVLHKHRVPMPEPATNCEVDWISGTSMLIRRQVFEQIGSFDEGFFLYFEETDFCRSARRAGWKICYVADAPVTHLGSVSTGLADPSRRMPRYWFDSRHRYLLKHHGRAYTALCDGAFVVGSVLWRIKQHLLRRDGKDRPHLLQDMLASSVRDLAGWRTRV